MKKILISLIAIIAISCGGKHTEISRQTKTDTIVIENVNVVYLDNQFNEAVSNQIRCIDPFMEALKTGDLRKARLYCDSIAYYGDRVVSIYDLILENEIR